MCVCVCMFVSVCVCERERERERGRERESVCVSVCVRESVCVWLVLTYFGLVCVSVFPLYIFLSFLSLFHSVKVCLICYNLCACARVRLCLCVCVCVRDFFPLPVYTCQSFSVFCCQLQNR